jgi:alpha-tubulin suppressor-like RCC1 family protein
MFGLAVVPLGCREDTEPPTAPISESLLAEIGTTALAFRQVSVGAGHACGVTTDSQIYCWGDNGSGELGNGTIEASSRPVAVVGGGRFRLVSAGRAFTCAVSIDDRGFCWGHNPYGELGNGSPGPETCFAGIECSTRPVQLAGSLRLSEVTAGQDHACGVTTSNRIYCWGWNGFGQLGDGTTTNRLAPVRVARSVRFTHVDSGYYDSFEIKFHCG